MSSHNMLAADSLWAEAVRLYGHLSPARKRQLCFVLALAIIGAMGELMTLGAILPFLSLMADPAKAASYPILQTLFTSLGWSEPGNILLPLTVMFGAVALVSGAIRVYLNWQTQKFAFQVGHDFSVEMYKRTLCQPYIYHVSKNTSESISAVNKIDAIVYGTLLESMQLITSTIISVFIVAALVLLDPVVAMSAAIGFAAIYLGVTVVVRRRLQANSRTWAAAQSGRVKTLQEGLGGIRDVLIDQIQHIFIDKYRDVDGGLRHAQAVSMFIGAAPRFVIESCGMVLFASVAYLLSQGSGGLGNALPILGVLALGAQRLLPMLQQIYRAWTIIAANQESLLNVFDILELPVDTRYEGAAKQPIPFKRGITIDHVGFRYSPDTPEVLHDISLKIKPGTRVGLIGKTGSGKSTLVDLVMGLLSPTTGEIRIDDTALTADNVRGWQSQIAHVPQAIYLSDSTITENIAFGVPKDEIDLERIHAAARGSKLDEFITGLPEGYQTVVGERGVRLSGGQRQRIGIARALYKQASVLVFDEATSALDNATEAAVMEAIQSLDRNLTILMIAHRLSTLTLCDTVIRLDAGHLISEEPPETALVEDWKLGA